MKIRLMTTVCLLLFVAVGTFAQHWTVNVHAWQYDMTVYAQLKTGGVAVNDYADYEVAAFCGDECRGVAKVQALDGEKPWLYLRIYSNVTKGETITFHVYKSSAAEDKRLKETLSFEAQTVAGTPSEPIALTLTEALQGDADGDGVVAIADAISIVDFLLGKGTSSFNEAAADVNGDGVVDIADAVAIVNKIIK